MTRIELHAQEAQEDVVSEIVLSLVRMITTRTSALNNFHLALTGGRVGTEITQALIAHPLVLGCKSLHLWFSDERFTSELTERNDSVLSHVDENFKPHVHRVAGPDVVGSVELATKAYATELDTFTTTRAFATNTLMDVTLLSIGPDGHIASLFPESDLLNHKEAVLGVLDSPKPPAQRVTWSFETINSSEQVWLVATGAEKRVVVDHLLAGTTPLTQIPAMGIKGTESTKLFVDSAAFDSDSADAEDFI